MENPARSVPRPFGLLAEVTFRCPLHCAYCSNPRQHSAGEELGAEEWRRVFHQASELGVYHVLLSGGEPLLRPDLVEIVAAARESGLYVNLLTSGVGLTARRARILKDAGLDHVQISFQADEAALADPLAGRESHAAKVRAARAVRALRLPLTLNVVLHAANIDRVDGVIRLATYLGARRLELASAQYYGWALRNRTALMPTKAQLEAVAPVIRAAQTRLRGQLEILYVLSDYFGDRPKPCMGGWGQRYVTVNPVGQVLPCPTAYEIPDMHFETLQVRSLASIWSESESFNRFRGTAWMREPCLSCPERARDFGGCRCQAAILTGDPANTDPACALSPHREVLRRASEPRKYARMPLGLVPRTDPAAQICLEE